MQTQTVNFDKQVQNFAFQSLSALSALAPIIILAAMLGAFAWVGFMDYLYFSTTLPAAGLAILAAVFLQAMRFGCALGSVRMLMRGRLAGILFLGASLLLTYLESSHVVEQAAALASTPAAISANTYLIKIAVWASVGLEILVALLFAQLYTDNETEGKESGNKESLQAEQREQRAEQMEKPDQPAQIDLGNGNGVK